ncbi:MAG TPA: hypothetical protein VGV89_10880 [Thermoplasmata archaeon]|nr:hypothetical protein [Thermoplasmata archaeon]
MGEVGHGGSARERTGRIGDWALGAFVVALVVAGATALAPRPFGLSVPSTPSHAEVIGAGVGQSLAVTPSSWTMVAGGTFAVAAYLIDPDNGCVPISAVITWQLTGEGALLGYLNTTSGPEGEFTSFEYESGTARLNAVAVGVELCGAVLGTFTASAVSVVQVVAPLSVGSLLPVQDPVVTGTYAEFTTTITGGLAPYDAEFDFGDGGSTMVTASSPGALTVEHRYATGNYSATATVRDALGDESDAPAGGVLEVAGALGVRIDAATLQPEVGIPLRLTAGVVNAIGPATILWNDSDGHSGSGGSFVLNLSTAGPAVVRVVVRDGLGDAANATASLDVQPPLNLTIRAPEGSSDLGEPLPIEMAIRGGSAPYTLSGGVIPSGSRFLFQGVSAGDLSEAVVPTGLGPSWVEGQLTDALGASTSVQVPAATVVDEPSVSGNLTPGQPETGDAVEFAGLVAGGVAPFNWSVRSAAVPSAESAPEGSSTTGLIAWAGAWADPGPVVLQIVVRDATGALSEFNRSFEVTPPLSVTLGTLSGPGSAESLLAQVRGGVPPYNLTIVGTGEPLRSTVATSAGVSDWTIAPAANGTQSYELIVRDGSGHAVERFLNVSGGSGGSPPAGASAPPGTLPTDRYGGGSSTVPALLGGVGAGAGVGLVLLAGWLVLRRRGASTPPGRPGPSAAALALVRTLLKREESLDREALLLLAEEESADPETIPPALDRWVELGRVLRTRDVDGVDQYRWSGSADLPAHEGDHDPDGEAR